VEGDLLFDAEAGDDDLLVLTAPFVPLFACFDMIVLKFI
jgi:hypothetical protein